MLLGILIILIGVFVEMPEWLSIMCYIIGGLEVLTGSITWSAKSIAKN